MQRWHVHTNFNRSQSHVGWGSWLEKGETLLESELQQRQAELAQLQAEEDEDGFEDESDSGSEAEEPEDHKEPRATSMQSGALV